MVAAIDFGSTFSGCAFSLIHELESDPLRVNAPSWLSNNTKSNLFKTPTILLLNKEGNFVGFGSDAETAYAELSEDGAQEDYFYFYQFKMLLYDQIRKNV